MPHRILIPFVGFVIASGALADCGTPADEGAGAYATGQILVRFAEDVSDAEAARIISRVGGREVDRLLDGAIYVIEFPYLSAQFQIIDALNSTKGVLYAEPNQPVSIPEPPKSNEGEDGGRELIPLPRVD